MACTYFILNGIWAFPKTISHRILPLVAMEWHHLVTRCDGVTQHPNMWRVTMLTKQTIVVCSGLYCIQILFPSIFLLCLDNVRWLAVAMDTVVTSSKFPAWNNSCTVEAGMSVLCVICTHTHTPPTHNLHTQTCTHTHSHSHSTDVYKNTFETRTPL